MKTATKLTVALLTIVSLVHLVRLFAGWPATVAGYDVPVWVSAFGFFIPGALAWFVMREHQD